MTSAAPVSNEVKKIWDQWNLRSFIILSLSLQTFLILFAPLRMRTTSKWVIVPIWLAYLLADWAANFAIGLIASSQTEEESKDNGNLLAFWAPFLLLHLGGPDTIIAISMEDNALWPRHLLGLVFQVLAAVYVFIMQASTKNKLMIPTLLLFFPGIVKYAERTRALYLASLDSLKDKILAVPEPGPDYAKYMDEYWSRKTASLPVFIDTKPGRGPESRNVNNYLVEEEVEGKDNDIAVVQNAHHFYKDSMGLIIDLIFDYHQRQESRAYFHKRNSEETFTVLATELNFIYEALYTKVSVVHSTAGYVLRATSFCAVCIAFVYFYKLEKVDFEAFDVGVTYSLLIGAIILDSITLWMLVLSDWTVAGLNKYFRKSWIASVMWHYLNLKRSWWPDDPIQTTNCLKRTSHILFRRWSESVSVFGFIYYSLQEAGKVHDTFLDCFVVLYLEIIKFMGLKDLRDEMKYRSKEPVRKELWDFIFKELKSKSVLADDPETGSKICSAKGEWILRMKYGDRPECSKLLTYVVDVTYDRSILLWHIATELCYYVDKHKYDRRDFSKTLSDYMLYLLIMQPTLMSSVAGIGQKRFCDTIEEAKQFFKKRELGSDTEEACEKACEKLLEVNTEVKPVDVKGNRSKSVLFDACILARELSKLESHRKWELISEVWVELLSYAASHCRANSHAQLLSKGGELVTFIWLLMARFGISEQFQVLEVQARVKLIVGKPNEIYEKAKL